MNSIVNILKSNPLPGEIAHRLMKPAGRRLARAHAFANPVHSAVMLLLVESESGNDTSIVFIKRAISNGVHSGQIAFPGGRYELTDESFAQTALRETREETGIVAPVDIIGRLSDLFVPPSNYLIHPYVGIVREPVQFLPNEAEVQWLFTENILHFVSPFSRDTYYYYYAGESRQAPCFISNGYAIWGATAMILSEFLLILQNGGYFKEKNK
ncbi:MAG: CoA pyrophosphatase [Bacteroidetes bacterium HGW-Bacteroidetes-6]|jgi:8-oxo-dGTP pyrophosphatase MutT (NUDIX family)|nr:MAG: CoA pyrophosphatase [Bacteroidetes bacterium HGW-Bacteroidetes-6]